MEHDKRLADERALPLKFEADGSSPPISRGAGSGLAYRATTGFGVGASPGLANGTSLEDSSSSTSPGDRGPGASWGLRGSSSAAGLRMAQTPPRTESSSGLRSLTPPRTGTSSGPVTPGQRTPRNSQAAPSSSLGPSGDWRNFLKRELELTETRLAAQLTKVRESAAAALDKTDRVREVAIQRIDQKLSAQEAVQTKLDRKFSELNGALRGLSDETQSHIRRMDGADARLWEFRHQMEEEFRQKCVELAEQQQAASSKCKVLISACDETTRRLGQRVKRIEATVEDKLGQPSEDVARSIADLQVRLEHVEEVQHGEARGALAYEASDHIDSNEKASADMDADARYMDVQRQLNNLAQAFEDLRLEAHGDDGWCSKLEEHEIRLGGFRQKMDSQDQLYQTFDEKVRQDWDSKLHSLHKNIQEHGQRHLRSGERMDEFDQWARAVDTAVEELYHTGGSSASSKALRAEVEAVHELRDRVGQAEDGILRLAEKLREVSDPITMALAALSEQRKQVQASQDVDPEDLKAAARSATGHRAGAEDGVVVAPGQVDERLHEELADLFKRVDNNDEECAKLQDSLKGRIASMDTLLERVAREVLGSASEGGAQSLENISPRQETW